MENNPFKDNNKVLMIPNAAFEKEADRYMTIIRWLVIVIVVLIVAFTGYVIYNSQMETVSYEQEAEATEGASVNMNASGEMNINGGESKADSDGSQEETEGSEKYADQNMQ